MILSMGVVEVAIGGVVSIARGMEWACMVVVGLEVSILEANN